MNATELYDSLRSDIIRNVHAPGAPLFETTLAKKSGLSRTPVRDVLKRLRDEGLVEVHPGRGSFVAPLNLARLREAIALRCLLEAEAAMTAASSPGAARLGRELGQIIAAQQDSLAAHELDEVYRLDQRFHELIFETAGLKMMRAAVRIARAEMERAHHIAVRDAARPRHAIRFHDRIRRAIAQNDPDAAKAEMIVHIESNLDYLINRARQHATLNEAAPA